MTISEEKDIVLKEFLGDLYDDLIVLTNNDKHRVLKILERYADKSVSSKESKTILNI